MRGYKTIYLVAALCLGFAAAFRSATYLILGKFIDVDRPTCTDMYDKTCRPMELLEEENGAAG